MGVFFYGTNTRKNLIRLPEKELLIIMLASRSNFTETLLFSFTWNPHIIIWPQGPDQGPTTNTWPRELLQGPTQNIKLLKVVGWQQRQKLQHVLWPSTARVQHLNQKWVAATGATSNATRQQRRHLHGNITFSKNDPEKYWQSNQVGLSRTSG